MASNDLQLDRIIETERFARALTAIAQDHADPASPAARNALFLFVKETIREGRETIRAMLDEDGGGILCAQRLSAFQDVVIAGLFDYAVKHAFRVDNPSTAEHLSVVAVGGYGRATLAPGSDIDLLFLLPYKETPWTESVVEFILYMLWDLGFKVGHATRNIDECVRLSRSDMTIRTAILDHRLICGSPELHSEMAQRFESSVMKNTTREFIAAKLDERNARHRKVGDSRYLVEPNIKEGKGGLRDLQTLFWLAKYHYDAAASRDLVKLGVLSRREANLFDKSGDFLWAVRCHMHFLTGKAEERLTFDIQREIAASLGYQDHPGLSAVERFMKHYFLVAKDVGDLTRIFCSTLEAEQAKESPSLTRVLRRFSQRPKKIPGTTDFIEDHGRINVADDEVFRRDPVNLIRLFHLADIHELKYHPEALKLVTRSHGLIKTELRENEEANRLFLSILTSRRDPELTLRRMNEAGVLGRFIREFGKIVSMMQFNMYHHYTVDEHLIRAVGILARLDRGEEEGSHPLAARIMPDIKDREVLYAAVLLHDVAKGRPEDHSVEGAKIARKLGPRLGFTSEQTDLLAWLIEQHLVMSLVAQTRDLHDRRTIVDFADTVQSLERLRMLLCLTVCDIRAVGPGVWNGWKGQLLRTLYGETELTLTGGFTTASARQRAADARAALAKELDGWTKKERDDYVKLHYQPYLLSVSTEDQVRHAEFIRETRKEDKVLATMVRTFCFHAITEITIYAPDHPRLLSIVAGACAAAGANIADAQIFTTTDGRALDTIMINREFDDDSDELRRGERIGKVIEDVLTGRKYLPEVIATKKTRRRRTRPFRVAPKVSISNTLSDYFTVIEIEGLDRVGLLSEVTAVLSDLSLDIGSAHITTFGERVIDTFYVRDLVGHKIVNENKQANIIARLRAAVAGVEDDMREKMPAGIIAPPAPVMRRGGRS